MEETKEVWIAHDDVRIRTLNGGSGDRVALFWPGTGLPAEEFLDLAGRMADLGYKTIVIEPPGHGRSDPWPGPWRWEDAAGLGSAALSFAGGVPALLVGHSLGGTELLMACPALSNVRGVVLLDGGLPLPAPYPTYDAAVQDLEDWVRDATFPDWEAWLRNAWADLRHWDDKVEAGALAMMRERPGGVGPAIDQPTIAAMLYCLAGYRPATAPNLSIPVLLLRGSEVPRMADVDDLHERLLHLTVQAVPGAGHELPWDAPDEVAERVLAFSEALDWSGSERDAQERGHDGADAAGES